MPKAFSEQEKQVIRERLLQEGERRFSAQGLQKTSVEELAMAAGISKGAFYGFYESKEALFMAVTEKAEKRFRLEVLAAIDRPGPTPRARLVHVLGRANGLWQQIPVLRFFALKDYELLMRKVPAAVFEEHARADEAFLDDLIAHCRSAGIPIAISADELQAMSYALFLTSFHSEDPLPLIVPSTVERLIELIAAYCLGEVTLGQHILDDPQ